MGTIILLSIASILTALGILLLFTAYYFTHSNADLYQTLRRMNSNFSAALWGNVEENPEFDILRQDGIAYSRKNDVWVPQGKLSDAAVEACLSTKP